MLGRHKKDPIEISPPLPLNQCLAKSYRNSNDFNLPGQKILDHSRIVGAVAKALVSRMPEWLRENLFPPGSELVASLHDIGKVSPTFQKKIYQALTTSNNEIISRFSNINSEIEKNWGGHAGVSQVTAEYQKIGRYIPEVLGQHHGFSQNLSYRANADVFGGDPWLLQRIELIKSLKEILQCEPPQIRNEAQSLVLAGLTSVSDWVGSGHLFENPEEEWVGKIEQALDQAGFIAPDFRQGLSFFDVFELKENPSQSMFIAKADKPGVYVLEAPMGLGKTEAALYVAYRLMEDRKATGFYFALPTQLTSDKIHERVDSFLAKVLSDRSPHRSALLLHGNAWLTMSEMGEEGNPGGSWFSYGKRGILAPFGVGTIDQALMAVMNVKHGFVRTFGLAGKVVILDEVHSYDKYTGTILDKLVMMLRELHCTVIILSATLTRNRRHELLGTSPQSDAYPLITSWSPDSFEEISPEPIPDSSVAIFHRHDSVAVEEVLLRAEKGEQVLWIENTVSEAQEVFQILSARSHEIGVACGLLHSRFTRSDRSDIEKKWVGFFGKSGAPDRDKKGRILVGTQVLEQSLDIDADFLVSRFAPTDMLLQRLGRLWRHSETKRPESARREAWFLSPDLEKVCDMPRKSFGKSADVYSPYVLCRSLIVWKELSQVMVPGQIRPLIEATYQTRNEKGAMAKLLQMLESEREKLQRFALIGLSRGGKTLNEEKAKTRYGEEMSVETLLIHSLQHDSNRKQTVVRLLNSESILVPWNGRSISPKQLKGLCATLRQFTLRVPEYKAPPVVSQNELKWLRDYFYLGNPDYGEDPLLRVGIVDERNHIRSVSGELSGDGIVLSYDRVTGYQFKKKGV